jgi:hypothetical protein
MICSRVRPSTSIASQIRWASSALAGPIAREPTKRLRISS